jgi:hypothetical protein
LKILCSYPIVTSQPFSFSSRTLGRPLDYV